MPTRHQNGLARWIEREDQPAFRPPRTREEIEADRLQSRLIAVPSLLASKRRIAEWLAVPCEKHGAAAGERCSEFVGGICGARIEASRA